MPSEIPSRSAGRSVPKRIVRCCARASSNTSWRLAYSFNSERLFSSPLNSRNKGIHHICAFSTQRQTALEMSRRIASLQASKQSASQSQRPLPIEVLASGLSADAICVAASPALQNRRINSPSERSSVSHCAGRPCQSDRITHAPSDAASHPGVNGQTCQSALPSPDIRRLGATFTNGNATAAMAVQANSSSTRL